MARQVTLEALEAQVRWQSDMVGAELRHDPADLRLEIVESIRRYREWISDRGSSYFLRAWAGTLPVGYGHPDGDPTINLGFGVMDISSVDPPVVQVYGMDVYEGQSMNELQKVEFEMRNFYQNDLRSLLDYRTGPLAFFLYDSTKLGILPAVQASLKFVLWYLPDIRDLTEDDDVFDPAINGGEKWVVWDVCEKIASRDNYQPMLAAANLGKASIAQELSRRAPSKVKGGMKRLDTKARQSRSRLPR